MEDPSVRTTATHTIRCANSHSVAALPSPFYLGPLDHLGSPIIPIGTVWVYESSPTCPAPVPIARLNRAVALLLDYYPQLTGRLTIDPQTGVRTITRFGTGISAVEAICNTKLTAFRDAATGDLSISNLPGSGVALLAPWNPTEEDAQQDPLLTFKHVRFACGSVAIGVRLARVMAGAGGFLQLYRNLAKIYNGLGQDETQIVALEQKPHIIPFMVEEMSEGKSRADTASYQPRGYSVKSNVRTSDEAQVETDLQAEALRVVGRELCFSSSELAALKASATPPDGTSWVSTFSALSAHIWQRTEIARHSLNSSAHPSSVFFTSVDFSSKLNLPPHFFPSSVVTPSLELSATELCTEPLWHVARAIHGMTRSVDPDDVRSLATWVAAQPQKQLIRQNIPFGSNAVITTAWNKYSLYAGCGLEVEPTIVGVPFTPTNLVDGLAFFLQSKEDNGDIIVALALSESVWEVLDRDAAFRHFKP
ncbi:hypothetical protein NM208_g12544 [Fusarium decemcellulare]|uniref:Uncharacterized protein n=1 Tax=Fusarium decemcellulare TaxID=57161 RepID=A0ACC1RN70_9HYPO|nr:hypothetical protein NM208_g12544 [Fusarium decemcellulare]